MIHSLIGKKYRLGADGSDGEIDCIHLVYSVLNEMQIAAPAFKEEWYSASTREILRDLNSWGQRVDFPAYDGDVVLEKNNISWSFGVTWQRGVLHINRLTERVAWVPLCNLIAVRCYRMKGKLLK